MGVYLYAALVVLPRGKEEGAVQQGVPVSHGGLKENKFFPDKKKEQKSKLTNTNVPLCH